MGPSPLVPGEHARAGVRVGDGECRIEEVIGHTGTTVRIWSVTSAVGHCSFRWDTRFAYLWHFVRSEGEGVLNDLVHSERTKWRDCR